MLGTAEPRFQVAPVASLRPEIDRRALALAAGLTFFTFLVVRTAWVCDDAYITLRTVDNFVHGYGLRWNVAERVQAFTHPLWLFVLSAAYASTHEAFFTTIAVSLALSIATVLLFATRLASSVESMVVGLAAFVFSKAFVEFSTSGLENPLTTFLLAAFFAVYWNRQRRRELRLWAVAGLIVLNRIDTAVLLLPMLAAEAWGRPWRETVKCAAIGLSPAIAWELFAIVYYGFPVPNTAYAKLQPGIAAPALIGQGVLYLVDSTVYDPLTLLIITAAMAVSLRVDRRGTWPIAAGIGLYLACVVRAGGDFMSGRFLVAPFFCAVAAGARLRWSPSAAAWTMAGVALIGVTATTHPPVTSGPDTFADGPKFGISGVADERSWDYPNAGLLRWTRERPLPTGEWVQYGRSLRGQSRVVVRANIGLFGYFAGPSVRVIDAYGLADPLLARLPTLQPWRIGHFERAIPDGYEESLRTGVNRIADPKIAGLYQDVKLVAEGPLWSRSRWRAIRRLNLGW